MIATNVPVPFSVQVWQNQRRRVKRKRLSNLKCDINKPGMVEINVVPMHGVNSEEDQRTGLVSVLMEAAPRHRWSIKINRHNAVAPSDVSAATSRAANDLIGAFRAAGFGVEWYETDGQDIEAACGQLHHQTAA